MQKVKKTLPPILLIFVILAAAIGIYALVVVSGQDSQAETDQKLNAASSKVPVTFRVSVPETTPNDQTIYISGSAPAMGAWEAAGVALEPAGDEPQVHTVTLSLVNDVEYGYKVTRGTWSTVERAENDRDLDNRLIRADAARTVDVGVAEWVDKGKSDPSKVTLTGDIRYHRGLIGDGLELPRDLIVWLPPGYGQSENFRYPVLYLQDGQNLFDASSSFQGIEWQVDENARDVIQDDKAPPFIVVGITNTYNRNAEYTPGTETAAAFADFVVEKVKPLIEEKYQAAVEAQDNAIGGAGLGAMASMLTVDRHPDAFGQLVALAPLKWGATEDMLSELKFDSSTWSDMEIWVSDEKVAQRLRDAGSTSVTVKAADDKADNEESWAKLMPEILVALFGK